MKKVACGALVSLMVTTAAYAEEDYRFVVVPKVVHPWFDIVVDGARDAAALLAEQTGDSFEVEYLAPQTANVIDQNNIVERAIATGPTGIMIDMLDASANEPVLQEAKDRGISVVIFDNWGPNENLKAPVIGNDLCKMAEEAAHEVVRLMGGKGEVALIEGVPTSPTHATRARCGRETIDTYPDVTIVAEGVDNEDIETAREQAAAIMQAHPNLGGFLAGSGGGPVGIGQAISEAGKLGEVHYIGYDNIEQIIDQVNQGMTTKSISTDPYQQGYWSLIIMWQEALGARGPQVFDTGTFDILPGYGQ